MISKMNEVVSIRELSKTHQETPALKDISFSIDVGTISGIIGPDGAGKTSLLRILVGLEKADKGEAIVLGNELPRMASRLKGIVGYIPERFSLYPDLSVKENLNFYAKIHNTTIEENYHIIQPIYSQIEPFNNRLAGRLSGGMKQKLALSCALVHRPVLLILDEPTTGVDAVSRNEFWEILKLLVHEGLTIIVSTPYMDEARQCGNIILLHQGKVLYSQSPLELLRDYKMDLFRITGGDKFKLKAEILNYTNAVNVSLFGQGLHVALKREPSSGNLLNQFLALRGYTDLMIEKIKPGIEDCFISLIPKTETENTI
jgi:ABC-2 type transport system ATP-binding protein